MKFFIEPEIFGTKIIYFFFDRLGFGKVIGLGPGNMIKPFGIEILFY